MERLIYLDHAATTCVDDRVVNKMLPYFHLCYGNPSSIYEIGRSNKRIIEEARKQVAGIIGAKQKEIYFTSCGTESDNLALKGVAYANQNRGKHMITSRIEHPAILNTCHALEKQGFEITYLGVDSKGRIMPEELNNAIREGTILISIMTANNEIGTIEPIETIGKIAKDHHIYFHTDSVQAMGNIKMNVEKMNIDLLSMSAHKFYGPKGVGAIYIREGTNISRVQDGGHQEKGMRSGTENVAGIVGLAEALKLADGAMEKNNQKILQLRKYFIEKLKRIYPQIKINGDLENRLPGNINVTFPNYDGQDLLFKLDEKGICASAGSACSAGDSSPSHVLTAIGLTAKEAEGTLRFSLGKENTKEEIDDVIDVLQNIISI